MPTGSVTPTPLPATARPTLPPVPPPSTPGVPPSPTSPSELFGTSLVRADAYTTYIDAPRGTSTLVASDTFADVATTDYRFGKPAFVKVPEGAGFDGAVAQAAALSARYVDDTPKDGRQFPLMGVVQVASGAMYVTPLGFTETNGGYVQPISKPMVDDQWQRAMHLEYTKLDSALLAVVTADSVADLRDAPVASPSAS